MSSLAAMVALVWEALVQMGAVYLLKFVHVLTSGGSEYLALFGATFELAQFWAELGMAV